MSGGSIPPRALFPEHALVALSRFAILLYALLAASPSIVASQSAVRRRGCPAIVRVPGSVRNGHQPVYESCHLDRPPVLRVPAPSYPPMMRSANVEGTVLTEFVVDTNGAVIANTIRTLRSTHQQFTDAVQRVIRRTRGRPGRLRGRAVRAWVRYDFEFGGSCSGETIDPLDATLPVTIVCIPAK